MPEAATAPKPYQCRHIFTEGRQCGSPALRGEKLCFYHHTTRRPLAGRDAGSDTGRIILPAPNDLHAIQRSIGEVLRLRNACKIDDIHTNTLLRGLAIASANLARIHRHQRAEARAAASPRLQSAPAEAVAAVPAPAFPVLYVQDYVDDPLLGTLAPAPAGDHPDPQPRPDGPLPEPLPVLSPGPEEVSDPIEDAKTKAMYEAAHKLMADAARTRTLLYDDTPIPLAPFTPGLSNKSRPISHQMNTLIPQEKIYQATP